MTFDQYVAYVGTPENLAREAGWWLGPRRQDFSGLLRARYARAQLSEAQVAAIRWLAAQPGGPVKVRVISRSGRLTAAVTFRCWRAWPKRAVWSSVSSRATARSSAAAR